jgi:hypothetical protein
MASSLGGNFHQARDIERGKQNKLPILRMLMHDLDGGSLKGGKPNAKGGAYWPP